MSPDAFPVVLRGDQNEFSALRLNRGFENVGLIRLADVIGLVRNIHGLAGDLGEVAPHFHQPLRAQSLIIKCAHAVQDRVALRCCLGLSLELLRRKYFPTEPELAGRDDVLLNEEAVFAAPEQ